MSPRKTTQKARHILPMYVMGFYCCCVCQRMVRAGWGAKPKEKENKEKINLKRK